MVCVKVRGHCMASVFYPFKNTYICLLRYVCMYISGHVPQTEQPVGADSHLPPCGS